MSNSISDTLLQSLADENIGEFIDKPSMYAPLKGGCGLKGGCNFKGGDFMSTWSTNTCLRYSVYVAIVLCVCLAIYALYRWYVVNQQKKQA